MPHGFRRADYWLLPWQIRAIQRLAESTHSTPSAVVRDLLSTALPVSLRPPLTPDGLHPELVVDAPSTEPVTPDAP